MIVAYMCRTMGWGSTHDSGLCVGWGTGGECTTVRYVCGRTARVWSSIAGSVTPYMKGVGNKGDKWREPGTRSMEHARGAIGASATNLLYAL